MAVVSNETSGIERSIRFLGTFCAIVVGGLGFATWRLSAAELQIFHDLGIKETWRQPILSALGSPIAVAVALVCCCLLLWASWSLSLPRAAWLVFGVVIGIVVLFVAAVVFFFFMMTFPVHEMA
jgi:hypothetical protein